jgi:glycosyltransferase involved in cell wall biosynthesis
MKVGILTVAYNEEQFIGACIKQFQHTGLEHLVLLSLNPWNGASFKPDRTNDIASKLGAEVVVGDWDTEAHQRNYGLNYFKEKDYDWVLIVDADELYSPEDIAKLSYSLEQDVEAIVANDMVVYWKDINHVVTPKQEDRPIIAIRPDQKFIVARQSFSNIGETEARLHHLSYVRDDEGMLKKIKSFSHAVDFNTDEWYEQVWLDWAEGDCDLHPVNPHQFATTLKKEAPDWMKELFV